MSEGRFQVGDRFIVNDKHRLWAHEEEGVVLAVYPPGAESPAEYEALVSGRPLIIGPQNMTTIEAKGVTHGD